MWLTAEWQAGLKAAGLRAYHGDDAGAQPGSVGDVLLHEAAASWLRAGLTATTPASPETETEADYYARRQNACADVKKRHDVSGKSPLLKFPRPPDTESHWDTVASGTGHDGIVRGRRF